MPSSELPQLLEWLLILLGGYLAGTINVMVGAGTLISFPIMVALGVPPLTATMSNTVGIVPASFTGTLVYRKEIGTHRGLVKKLLPASIAGALLGALLLMSFSGDVFSQVVPWLILLSTVLVVLSPIIKNQIAKRQNSKQNVTPRVDHFVSTPAFIIGIILIFFTGTYGAYFSAAQGVLFIGIMGIVTTLSMQNINALKNLTTMFVNAIAAGMYIIFAWETISWPLILVLAIGATLGGITGGKFAKRLSPTLLRAFVVVVGTIATIAMLT